MRSGGSGILRTEFKSCPPYIMYINSRGRDIYSLADPAALMLHCIRSGRPSGYGINFLLLLYLQKDTLDVVQQQDVQLSVLIRPLILLYSFFFFYIVPFNSIRNQIKWNYIETCNKNKEDLISKFIKDFN